MKILTISDLESAALWDHFKPERLADIDLILSCGDLDPRYLSFLATFSREPVLYVHGNHDTSYHETPPEGCICVDDRLYVHNGIRILGLGGSMRYKPGAHQYTEKEMRLRALKLWPQIVSHRGFDILLTHAPALGLGDYDSLAHRGFSTFVTLLDHYAPAYMIHGHVHLSYDATAPRVRRYRETTLVNAYERFVLDCDLPSGPPY